MNIARRWLHKYTNPKKSIKPSGFCVQSMALQEWQHGFERFSWMKMAMCGTCWGSSTLSQVLRSKGSQQIYILIYIIFELSYIILYYIVLYYVIFYYFILYYVILYFVILYYVMLYYIILYYIMFFSYYTLLYYILLFYIVLYDMYLHYCLSLFYVTFY